VTTLFRAMSVCLAMGTALLLIGCDEPEKLTAKPIAMDIYVDSTFSNDEVAPECMPDVMAAARLTAGSRGYLDFHTFDGDPFRRRGTTESFTEGRVPPDVEGTSGEIKHLEGEADDLEAEFEELIAEPPEVGGSPLVLLLERAARSAPHPGARNLILICTDGLFTDVNPLVMDLAEAKASGKALGPNLRGVKVEFIGLDGSAPNRGKRIEQTKPLVHELLTAAGAELGNWELELPSAWRDQTIAIAGGSSK
jgi:hypothetical protein